MIFIFNRARAGERAPIVLIGTCLDKVREGGGRGGRAGRVKESEETFERLRQSYPSLWQVVFSMGGRADYSKLKVIIFIFLFFSFLFFLLTLLFSNKNLQEVLGMCCLRSFERVVVSQRVLWLEEALLLKQQNRKKKGWGGAETGETGEGSEGGGGGEGGERTGEGAKLPVLEWEKLKSLKLSRSSFYSSFSSPLSLTSTNSLTDKRGRDSKGGKGVGRGGEGEGGEGGRTICVSTVMEEGDLREALRVLRDFGTVQYFEGLGEGLKNLIIIDPQFLARLFTHFVTAKASFIQRGFYFFFWRFCLVIPSPSLSF